KMSKTKGNTIDPLEVIEQYGTDAVRFALLRGAAPGMDIALSEERMASSRAFANKIWNAARFLFLQMERVGMEGLSLDSPPDAVGRPRPIAGATPLEDRWIRHRLHEAAARMDAAQRNYRYHEAADIVWTFLWDDFCDWYVEIKKLRIQQGVEARAHVETMAETFEMALRLLHPLMPFLSEELWQRLVRKGAGTPSSICIAPYPQAGDAADEEAERQFSLLQSIVTAARALRADNKVDPGARVEGWIESASADVAGLARAELAVIEALAGGAFEINPAARPTGVRRAAADFAVGLKLTGAQVDAIRARVEKRMAELEKVIASSRKQLASDSFVSRAPAHVVEGIREKLAAYEKELAGQQALLEELAQ
ncbi:MAG: class I tRNA ligase family protein, partial [Bryobacteraceae bacterium]|nr:class I tRNA ligase family protein [Bryobacteraceae bacterium]